MLFLNSIMICGGISIVCYVETFIFYKVYSETLSNCCHEQEASGGIFALVHMLKLLGK